VPKFNKGLASDSQEELMRAIAQIRKFQTELTSIEQFKALIWETRFVLTKIQSEILTNAIKEGKANKETLVLLRMLNAAVHTCNEVEALSHDPTSNEKLLSSVLLAQSNFAVIEHLLVKKP
jgi:histidinol phosphatase-like enzyme